MARKTMRKKAKRKATKKKAKRKTKKKVGRSGTESRVGKPAARDPALVAIVITLLILGGLMAGGYWWIANY